jgi:hypothetical protein
VAIFFTTGTAPFNSETIPTSIQFSFDVDASRGRKSRNAATPMELKIPAKTVNGNRSRKLRRFPGDGWVLLDMGSNSLR